MSNLLRIRKQIADADAAGMFKRERFEEALRTGKKIELTLELELADEIQIAGKVVHSGIKNPDALLETVLRFGATIDRLDVFELLNGLEPVRSNIDIVASPPQEFMDTGSQIFIVINDQDSHLRFSI